MADKETEELSINTLRFLAVDGVEKAKSGHPGMPMGDAAMAYVLWTKFLRHNPKNPRWAGRDRFVLSAGHGSMLLYGLLHLTGYDLSLDDLKNFRQWGSPTAGHPEYDPERGIEMTTGPLGQGFATGVGMAMASRYLKDNYGALFDYNIYAIVSDGELMEGVSNEAASLAGHLGLGSLVYLYSDNKITIEGSTDLSFTEDAAARFTALGWHVQTVDGNDLDGVEKAIAAAKAEKSKPSIIVARTHIGCGSPAKVDTADIHGAPLGTDEVKAAKEAVGWPLEPAFHVPDDALADFRSAVERGAAFESEWMGEFDKLPAEKRDEFLGLGEAVKKGGWISKLPEYTSGDGDVATRSVSGKCLNAIAEKAPFLVGGSADLAPSNNTEMKGLGFFTGSDGGFKSGRNIHFGVREHAMAAVMNGMALSGSLVPFGGTFLVFSDYMKPSIRLAALMGLHVVYVFTHDSIGLGEDGPTHQPVEHLAALRSIPNLTVIRPADATETVAAWKTAISECTGPVALILTRQKLPVIDREVLAPADGLSRGAYVLKDPADGKAEMILIATGSEVSLALDVSARLEGEGVKVRVVSMPSWELFEAQDDVYRLDVLPPRIAIRASIEAASSMGWHKYAGDDGFVVAIDSFGASAPYKTLFEKYGFTVDEVTNRALNLVSIKRDRYLDRM